MQFRNETLATDPQMQRGDIVSRSPSETSDNADALSAKAARCRRLAAGVSDRQATEVLTRLARNFEEAADRLAPKD